MDPNKLSPAAELGEDLVTPIDGGTGFHSPAKQYAELKRLISREDCWTGSPPTTRPRSPSPSASRR